MSDESLRELVNSRIKSRRLRQELINIVLWPLYLLLRLKRRTGRRRYGSSRIVILERPGALRASYRRRRGGFLAILADRLFWPESRTSPEYKEFPTLLMELSQQYSAFRQAQGQPISRQARRRFGRAIGSRI